MKALDKNTENPPEIKAAFTPGPWRWQGEDYRCGWGWQLLVGPNGEGIICGQGEGRSIYKHLQAKMPIDPKFCKTGMMADAESAPPVHVFEPDAKLIAAAPDMYEALKAFAAFADGWESRPLSGMDDAIYSIHGGPACGGYEIRLSDCIRARDALRKARGEAI